MSSNIFNPENGASYDANGQKIETPPAEATETVVETQQQAAEPPVADTPPAELPVETPPAAQPEFNWEEKTGGKYKSWDEIQAKLTEEPVKTEITYANDQSKLIAQYLSEGKFDDVRQVLNDQHRLSNADKVSDADAVKLMMEFKNTQF